MPTPSETYAAAISTAFGTLWNDPDFATAKAEILAAMNAAILVSSADPAVALAARQAVADAIMAAVRGFVRGSTLAKLTALGTDLASATGTYSGAVYQPLSANLTALSGLAGVADRLAYFTGAGAMSLATLTATGRSILAAVDAAAARVVVGLGNVDNTSDVNKPVSTAQAAADLLRVLKSGDTMTGGLIVTAGGIADSTLTAGRVLFAGATGRHTDDSRFLWDNVAKFLSIGSTYKFVVLGDQPANGDLPANHALMGSTLGSLCFFAATTTGGAAYKVICSYYNGSTIKSAWEISNTAAGALGHLQLMKNGGYVSIGGGTQLSKVVVYTPTLAPADVSGADEYNEQYFTVTGLSTSDTVIVNPPAMGSLHSQMICARVSAANTLALTFRALSGTHSPPQGVYRIVAIRS